MNGRIRTATKNNISVALFLLVFLFLPKTTTFIRPFFAIALISIPLFLGSLKKLYFDYLSFLGIGILVLYLLFSLLRFGFIVEPNLRDYTEFARLFLPVLILIFRDKFKDLSVKTLFVVFAFYTGIDFLISVLDFINWDILGVVSITKSIFVSEAHARVAFRVDGLSPGPSQHGVTMLIMFTFFYCRLFKSKTPLWPLFFSMIAAIPIFLSQSRTSMIAFAVVSLGVPIFYLLFGEKSAKRRTAPVLTLLVGGGGYMLFRFQEFFNRLFDLLGGLEAVSSYRDRLEGYEMLFSKAMEHPAFLVIGYGKEYFKTSVFDSEYIMMFLIYGPIITFIIIAGILIYLARFILKKNKTDYFYNTVLFFLLLVGLLIAFPASFFLETGVLPLLFIFVNLAYWENYSTNGKIMS